MQASTIITEVQADLLDEDGDRWSSDELLDYLNAGQRQIVFFKPTANAYTGVYQLVEGVKQGLPDGTSSYEDPTTAILPQAIELINITRNMGSDGLTDGNTIWPVLPSAMNEMFVTWRSATASATVVHYMYNKDDRKSFDVYPQQPSSNMGWIEVIYSAVPETISIITLNIELGDEYAEPLKNYIKSRAFGKDASTSQYSANRALAHWNTFVMQLGRKDLVEKYFDGVKDGDSISVQK